jgi:AcrR family transcriptional regulator
MAVKRKAPVPRPGGPRTSKSRLAREPLTRDRIEAAALALIERVGLAGFSQRALARDLGIEAMSLYHWYPSQLDLLNALLDRLLAEVRVPKAGRPGARLRATALALRELALRHPAFVGGFVLPHRWNTETGLALLEALLQVFHDAGLDGEMAARRFRVWMNFMMGALLDETTGYARGPGATRPLPEQVVAARFPLVAAMGPYNRPEHHEAHFRFGIEAVLRGLAG